MCIRDRFDVLLDVGVFALEPVDLGGGVTDKIRQDDGVAPAVRVEHALLGAGMQRFASDDHPRAGRVANIEVVFGSDFEPQPFRDGRVVGDLDNPVSYTHLRAHETVLDLVCRLLLEKKKQ